MMNTLCMYSVSDNIFVILTPAYSFMGRGVVNWPVRNIAQLLAEDLKETCKWENYLAVSIITHVCN